MDWTKEELEDWQRELASRYGNTLNKQAQWSLVSLCLELMEQLESK